MCVTRTRNVPRCTRTDNVFELSNISHANGIPGSQVGSQWPPTPSDVWPWLAIVIARQDHTGRHRAMSGDPSDLIWEQEAAGSNPAIPTRSEHKGKSDQD
jgi:hypothetical protein